jgi:hypothetical protein
MLMPKVKNHNKRAHSTLGASSAKRWLTCPGSIRMLKDIPSRTSSYAEEGTMAHELLEMCLLKEVDAKAFRDLKIKGKSIPKDMIDAVQMALDHILSHINDDTDLSVEEEFSLEWLYPGMFGTNDVCIREDFGDLHIMDYKHGAGVAVDVEDNAQLLFYAIGAAYNLKLKNFDDYQKVFLHIIQPRAYHIDGPIRVWGTSIGYLKEFSDILREGAVATTKKDALLVPTDEGCRFCDAKSLCPAVMKEAQLVAKSDFSEVEILSPEHLTLEEISKVVGKEKMIKEFLEACKERSKSALMNGEKIQGLKLVRKRSKRIWNRNDEEMEDALNEGGFTKLNPDNILEVKLKTVSKIEKIIGRKEFKKLAPYISTMEGGLDVAPISDKRKSAKVDATIDFDNV